MQLPEARPRGARQNPMKPAGEVCKDGCSASLHGEEPGFAVTKLGAEAGRGSEGRIARKNNAWRREKFNPWIKLKLSCRACELSLF